jgi:hypothetical protein
MKGRLQQMSDDDQKKKRQEETKRLQDQTQLHLDHLKLITESERIEFTRTKPKDDRRRDMTIYYDELTDEQKQELERIDHALFAMADEVTERGGLRKLKSNGEEKEGNV